MDFLELYLSKNAVRESCLIEGRLPERGAVDLYLPISRDETAFHSIDAVYLHQLNQRLTDLGYKDFDYAGHGEHAFVASAKNAKGDTRILRMHMGPLMPRSCSNVFGIASAFTLDDAISCEEMDYYEIIQIPSPKLTLGLSVACLAEGWDFWDYHGRNIAMRLGDTRVGVLEPHALTDIGIDHSYGMRIEKRILTLNQDRLLHLQYRRISPQASDSGFYCQGDVVETLKHTVVILDGDYYDSPTRDIAEHHPQREQRRAAMQHVLNQLQIGPVETPSPYLQDHFIVVPNPPGRGVGDGSSVTDLLRRELAKIEEKLPSSLADISLSARPPVIRG